MITRTKLGNLIKCRLKLKAQETLQCNANASAIDPQIRLQIDNMSIKIASSRNITNVSAIDPKVQLQMATSVCVYQLHIDQMSIKIESSKKYYKRVSYIPKSIPFFIYNTQFLENVKKLYLFSEKKGTLFQSSSPIL